MNAGLRHTGLSALLDVLRPVKPEIHAALLEGLFSIPITNSQLFLLLYMTVPMATELRRVDNEHVRLL